MSTVLRLLLVVVVVDADGLGDARDAEFSLIEGDVARLDDLACL